jgi:hypothetical protein
MGGQGRLDGDENEARGQGSSPPRERYDWPSLALFAVFLGAFIFALLRR